MVIIDTEEREGLSQVGPETKRHTNFTEDNIKEYLINFQQLVKDGAYTIAKNQNRQENVDFIEMYRINSFKEKEILLSLTHFDFCYAVDNIKQQYAHEKLYVFCKSLTLDNWGKPELVDIYIKSNLTQTRRNKDFLIVISFHERNKPISYLFVE